MTVSLILLTPVLERPPPTSYARIFLTVYMLLYLHLLGNLPFLLACLVPRNTGSVDATNASIFIICPSLLDVTKESPEFRVQ